MVRGSRSQEVVVKGRGQREEVGKEHPRGPILSKWVSPGKGAPSLEASLRELVWGSAERGTV